MWRIKRHAVRESVIAEGIATIEERREHRIREGMFGEWRHRQAVREMDRVVQEQSRKKLTGYCFTSMIAFTKLSKLER